MSTLKVNSIANNGSAVDFPNGAFNIGGKSILQGYTSSATEPASPSTGDFWWDSTNELLYQYLNSEFKAIGISNPFPWYVDTSSISYDSISTGTFNEQYPRSFRLSVDGTKMYVIGNDDDRVYRLDLSTAWDLSTASYVQNFGVSSQSTTPHGIDFSYDGTKMFIMQNGGTLFSYTLSTAWDVTSASYDNKSLLLSTINSANTGPLGLMFNIDGTKVYMPDYNGDKVYQYSLSTAFDISTLSYNNVSFGSASLFQSVTDIYVNRAETHIYLSDSVADTVVEIVMSTASDLTNASLTSSYSHATQADSAQGLHFSEDGTKMYILQFSNDTIYQYTSGSA
jgi:DNA-binding beta-propeller fold protein YncE